MQTTPLVSVGVPVHNGAPYIIDCIENLLRQDHPNIVINVFENCSTDNTVSLILPLLEDPRIRLHPAQSFLSAVENFSRAWDHVSSESEFFMLVACDDRISENYISSGVQNLLTHPGKEVVAGTVFHVSPNGVMKVIPLATKAIDPDAFRTLAGAMKKSQFPAPFIYGIYRGKEAVRVIQEAVRDYPSVWGNDRLALRYFILQRKFLLAPEMQFYFLTGSQSGALYGAASKRDRLSQLWKYCRALLSQRKHFEPLGFFGRIKFALWCFRSAEADTTYSIEKIILK